MGRVFVAHDGDIFEYSERDYPATGLHDPLMLQATCLRQGDRTVRSALYRRAGGGPCGVEWGYTNAWPEPKVLANGFGKLLERLIKTKGYTCIKCWTLSNETDGYFYLTYSGVHFLRPDYQIHSARGRSFERIAPHKTNPLIIHIEGKVNGMGNNNWITGPDLKTRYTTYHAKMGEGTFNPATQTQNR